MKKRIAILVLAIAMALATVACSKGNDKTDMKDGNMQENSSDMMTVTGKISEMKDFQFILETDDNKAYSFSIDSSKKPKGLEDVSTGDKVTVSYKGTLSEVDPFTGEIISVEKAK